jgi:hypothetical protein
MGGKIHRKVAGDLGRLQKKGEERIRKNEQERIGRLGGRRSGKMAREKIHRKVGKIAKNAKGQLTMGCARKRKDLTTRGTKREEEEKNKIKWGVLFQKAVATVTKK